MKRLFAPGCALVIYKPHLAERVQDILSANLGHVDRLATCCHHIPPLPAGGEVINVCPGCDRRYRENYRDVSTISLWEVLAESSFLPLPDYKGQEMTILDACPTRDQKRVQNAIRTVIEHMNISLVEPRKTRSKSTCCGDSAYGNIPTAKVTAKMGKKAAEMPAEDVIVYCVSCAKAMFVGGRRPRYLVDLVFKEETIPQTTDPDLWHKQLDAFIASHT
jgi:Fe-S oxidoreductase